MTLDRPSLAVQTIPRGELVASMFTNSAILFREDERAALAPLTLRYMAGERNLAEFSEGVRAAVVAAAIHVLADATKSVLSGSSSKNRLTLLSRDMPDLSNTRGVPANLEHEGVQIALEVLRSLGVAVGALGVEGGRPVLFVPERRQEVDLGSRRKP